MNNGEEVKFLGKEHLRSVLNNKKTGCDYCKYNVLNCYKENNTRITIKNKKAFFDIDGEIRICEKFEQIKGSSHESVRGIG